MENGGITHPSGKPFFAPVEYKGYVLETHNSREQQIKNMIKLCKDAGVEFIVK